MKMYSSDLFSLELLTESFENALEISGNLVSKKCGHPVKSYGIIVEPMSEFMLCCSLKLIALCFQIKRTK